jgi:hypothetical protein
MLFKVASWGLLALAWIWAVSTCESIESAHTLKRPWHFASAFDQEHADREYEHALAEWESNSPNPAVLFIGRHSTYVFPASILGVAWCFALGVRLKLWPVSEWPAGAYSAG